jgi:hypothetical protein
MKTIKDSGGYVIGHIFNKRELAAKFRAAANAIDKFGHIQYAMGSEGRGFCAVGALSHVMGYTDHLSVFSEPQFSYDVPADGCLFDELHKRGLPLTGYSGPATNINRIIHFNDNYSGDNGTDPAANVKGAFRAIARRLEHGESL